jgi:hypothetical protein
MIRHNNTGETGVPVKMDMFLPRAFAAGAALAGMHVGFIQISHPKSPSVFTPDIIPLFRPFGNIFFPPGQQKPGACFAPG